MPTNENPSITGGDNSTKGLRRPGDNVNPGGLAKAGTDTETGNSSRPPETRTGIGRLGAVCAIIAVIAFIGGFALLSTLDPSGRTSLGVFLVLAMAALVYGRMEDRFPKAPGGDAEQNVVFARAAHRVLIAVLLASVIALIVAAAV